MKKIISFICICLCCFCFYADVDAVAGIPMVITNNVEGYIGSDINAQNVEITFEHPEQYSFNVSNFTNNMDVTTWFDNIPSECTYTAKVLAVEDKKLTVQFTGTIGAGASESTTNITLTIPNSTTSYIHDLNSDIDVSDDVFNFDNTNAKYVISPMPDGIEYKGPYTVSGTVGVPLGDNQIVEVITTGSEEFDLSILGESLPVVNGLTPTITAMDEVFGKEITITYTGTPLAPSNDLISTTIDGLYLLLGETRTVPSRNDVKFNIQPINEPVPYTPPVKPFTPPKTGIE